MNEAAGRRQTQDLHDISQSLRSLVKIQQTMNENLVAAILSVKSWVDRMDHDAAIAARMQELVAAISLEESTSGDLNKEEDDGSERP